jgi:hypothetical protein
VVEKQKGQHIISTKWIYTKKTNKEGQVERYKARFVARGFTQVWGIDYFEIFSPVMKLSSVRLLLSIAAVNNLACVQYDIKTAFLNGILEEEIYVKPPEGTKEYQADKIWKLKKALYGLKQAPKRWNETLMNYLEQLGFRSNSMEPCLMKFNKVGRMILIGIYVDDLIVVTNSQGDLKWFDTKLNEKFEVKCLGSINWYLGIKVSRIREEKIFVLDQEQQIEKLKELFKIEGQQYVPMKSQRKKEIEEKGEFYECDYRKLIGKMMYLMICTRPDIAASIAILSKYLEKPTLARWITALELGKYLVTTKHWKLKLGGEIGGLNGYSDADWGGSETDSKSLSGYLFCYGNYTISWKSKYQSTVALSTTESEYVALSSSIQEALYLKQILENRFIRICHYTSERFLEFNQINLADYW